MSSSLLFTPSFKYPDGDFPKYQDFVDLNHHHHDYHRSHDNHHHQQQIQNHNFGLTRLRSAPSSFPENLVNVSSNGGGPGPETDTSLTRFMNGSVISGSHDLHEYEESSVKQEMPDSPKNHNGFSSGSSEMIYGGLPFHTLGIETKLDYSFGAMNSMMEISMMSNGSGNSLLRQNSSPAGLFSNPGADNGLTMTRDLANFGAFGREKGEVRSMTCGLNNPMNFASGASSSCFRLMPHIKEAGDEYMGASIHDDRTLRSHNSSNRHCHLNLANDESFHSLKRLRDSEGNIFSGLNPLESQTGKPLNGTLGFASTEMATIEKFLQFQGTVPCKIRAKRGCATHPRSIAERMRRTRISERIRKLQELFPEMDKQTNIADMLDLAVQYIKDLQKQVEMLADTKARCTCLRKQNQCSNASV